MEEKDKKETEKERKEREKKEKEEKLEKEKKLDKKVKNIIYIVSIVAIVLIVFFLFKDDVFDFIKEQAGTTFKYNNFDFEKFYYGELLMYKTAIYVYKDDVVVRYDLLLRNDPRELDENIEVFISNPKLGKRVYFSLAPETDDCNNTVLAAWKAGEFLGALGINTTGAVTDPSQIANSSYEQDPERVRTCEDAVNSTVIVLQKSPTNSSFISQEYDGEVYKDCFVLNYADCETVDVVERFILVFMEELKKDS